MNIQDDKGLLPLHLVVGIDMLTKAPAQQKDSNRAETEIKSWLTTVEMIAKSSTNHNAVDNMVCIWYSIGLLLVC